MTTVELSVVIPCFNEEASIHEMYKRLSSVLKRLTKAYEIIFIDNGSTDNSLVLFRKIASKDRTVKILVYARNFGPHGAYAGGLQYAKGRAVICIDGDLQDPPELISQFFEQWKQGFDVVYGIRKHREGSKVRKIASHFYYRILNKLSYIHIPLDAGDFALMDRKVVDLINAMPEHNKYFTALRAWVGFTQTGMPYNRVERFAGETKFNLFSYFSWAISGITSFSYKPLQLISYLAIFVVLMVGFAIFIYLLDFFFYPNNPRGFITLILVVLFLGGIQLLCLSIIGQYLAHIFEEVKNRPHFIVKEIITKHDYGKKTKKIATAK